MSVAIGNPAHHEAGARGADGHRDVGRPGFSGSPAVWAENVLTLTVQVVERADETTGFTVLAPICEHRRCVRAVRPGPTTTKR